MSLLKWIFQMGFEKGYNQALRDVSRSMDDRVLEDLEQELESLRLV